MATYNFTVTATTFTAIVAGNTRGTWSRVAQIDSQHSFKQDGNVFTFSLQNPFLSDSILSTDTIQIAGTPLTGTFTEKITQIKNQVFYMIGSYADDAAAATGGVPIGGFYHVSGAVKVRLA